MGVLGIIWNGLKWPFQMIAAGLSWCSKIRVTLLLASGAKVVFLCDRYETKTDGSRIVNLKTTSHIRFPHHVDVLKIDAIYHRKVSRWHRLPKD